MAIAFFRDSPAIAYGRWRGFAERMDGVYACSCPECSALRNENTGDGAEEMSVEIDMDELAHSLEKIYQVQGVERRDQWVEPSLWREVARVFNEAAARGLDRSEFTPPHADLFAKSIRESNEVFAAFKSHSMQREMAAQLFDDDGQLKSFARWVSDVEPIADHHVRRWLRTEYDTALNRAHQAADWRHFEDIKDVMPCVRWMPTVAATPDHYHRQYWEAQLTLPVDHPFWNSHRPGDRWNCQCSLRPTDDPPTDGTVADFDPIPIVPGLDNNPGRDGHLFSDSHPYFPDNCAACDLNRGFRNRMRGLFTAKRKDCYSCALVNAKLDKLQCKWSVKRYKGGGELRVHNLVDKSKSDYSDLHTIGEAFAKRGSVVELTPAVHYKSDEYKLFYNTLTDTKYFRKCPDMKIDGKFYEYESFVRPWSKRKVGDMVSHGLAQANRIIIDNNKGCSDRFIRKSLMSRIKCNGIDIEELWIYEKGQIRLFYKRI